MLQKSAFTHIAAQRSSLFNAVILFLCLCLLSIMICGCNPDGKRSDPWPSETPDQNAGYRQTVLYYQNDDGMMVPVMKLLPWEEGIGKAALNQLVDNQSNRLSSSMMGLNAVVPDGVSFVLSISDDAVATLNVCGLPDLETSEAEAAMVTALVNTLTEFPTIDQVKLQFDGKQIHELPHGTNVDKIMRKQPLNEEPLPVNAQPEDLHKMTLYYPNQSASLNVPVTRYTTAEPTLLSAINELLAGPLDDTLRNPFPDGTKVLNATMEDGIVTINLSSEFSSLSQTPELEEAALQTIHLTAGQFGPVTALNIVVDGKPYAPASSETMALSGYANVFR